jgi:hypothetical protein
MASPEQSQPARTGRTELDTRARSAPVSPSAPDQFGPEPEANQPGHHPPDEQDQPPLDEFASKFGIPPESPPSDTVSEEAPVSEDSPITEDAPVARDAPIAEDAPVTEVEPDRVAAPAARGLRAPAPVRQVWSVTIRRCVLPTLGGVRVVTERLERAARSSIPSR